MCPLEEPIDLTVCYGCKELRVLNLLLCCACSRKKSAPDKLQVIRIKPSFYDKSAYSSLGMNASKLLLFVSLLGRKTKLIANLVLVFDLTR